MYCCGRIDTKHNTAYRVCPVKDLSQFVKERIIRTQSLLNIMSLNLLFSIRKNNFKYKEEYHHRHAARDHRD